MSAVLPPEDQAPEAGEGLTLPALPHPAAGPAGTDGVIKNRADLFRLPEFSLDPASLCGSYCHRVENGDMVWQGQVVGEPQPGIYLVELEHCLPGADRIPTQVAYRLDDMLAKDDGYEWRFYDSEEKMRAAYVEYVNASERVPR